MSTPPPHDVVVDAFMTASRVMVALVARALASNEDVSLPQYRALVVLAAHRGPCHIGDIAVALAINPSSATRLVDRLARAGLVRRSRDPKDRRAVRVQLTRRGRDIVADVIRRRREDVEKLLGAVPVEQHAALVTALLALAAAAGESPESDLQRALNAVFREESI